MYNVLIIEDEPLAAERLKNLIIKISTDLEIIAIAESIKEGVNILSSGQSIDLIFADIQLTDGLSFEIFSNISRSPFIIFTTAYDEYAVKAFKLNSIDYLLKPIAIEELKSSIKKFYKMNSAVKQTDSLISLFAKLSKQDAVYKERFLVKERQSFIPVFSNEISYFYIDGQLLFIKTRDGKNYNIDLKIKQLEEVMDPKLFFRINRQMIVSVDSIKKMHPYFNNRLLLELDPVYDDDVVVSRDKVNSFKSWLDQTFY